MLDQCVRAGRVLVCEIGLSVLRSYVEARKASPKANWAPTLSIMGVGQTATASLVPLGLPDRINRRSTVAEHAGVSIEIVV